MSSNDPQPGAAELRARAEALIREKAAQSPENLAALSPEATQAMLHELQVHQIELELQNEELRRAQATLEDSRARYFELYDLAPVGYVTVSESGLILESNFAASTLLGVARGALAGQAFSRFILREDQDTYCLLRKRLFGTSEPQAGELRLAKLDGTPCWVQLAATTARGADGALVGRIVLADITARKQAEIKGRESEERFRIAIGALQEGFVTHDQDGAIVACNASMEQMLGLTAAQITGRTSLDPLWHVVHEDGSDFPGETHPAMVSLRQRIAQRDVVMGIHKPSGALTWLSVNSVPTELKDGRVVVVVTARDITEHRKAEAALRKSQGDFRGYFEMGSLGMCVTSPEKGWLAVNERLCQMLGYSKAELIGFSWAELTHPDDLGADLQLFEEVRAGKRERYELDKRFIRKDGSVVYTTLSVSCQRNTDGTADHFLASLLDITDHKTMQAHFLRAQRMEAIGALAGGIAHDLNNILAPVLMVTSLVKDKLTDEADRELLAMTHASAQRGGEVIKQLLIFSRGQDGERKVLQPRHLITEMGRMMRETFPREIKVQQQLPAVLWMIHADPTQVHQVLMNLCVNARDAMPDGGQLTVGAANVTLVAGNPKVPPRAKPGPHVVITVSDTGHGIPPQIKHLIFDPFFSTKPVGKGTGLGLSTVLGIVHSHGGFVDVDSTPNEGSTFKVYFPAIPDEVEAVAEVLAASVVPRTADQTILVVDDERTVREMTRILLERQHYRVLTAVNGEDALMQYLGHRTEVTLVLTDLMMPVMSGVNLIRALRVINPALKIVAMSGLTETVEAEKLTALGVPDVLTKPCSGPTLLEVVHRRLTGP